MPAPPLSETLKANIAAIKDGGAAAAPRDVPMHDAVLQTGSAGCFVPALLKCAAKSVQRFASDVKTDQMYRLQMKDQRLDTGDVMALLHQIDPDSDFTLPYSFACKVDATQKDAARTQCPTLHDLTAPIVQVSMRRGQSYYNVLKTVSDDAESKALTYHSLQTYLLPLLRLFYGVKHMNEWGLVHGDICSHSLLYFPDKNVLRLINFEFLYSFALFEQPEQQHQTARKEWKRVIDALPAATAFKRLKRVPIAMNWYSPPENALLQFSLYEYRGAKPVNKTTGLAPNEYCADLAQYYPTFPQLVFGKEEWDGEIAKLSAQIQDLRLAELLRPVHVLKHAYFPEKNCVFQLGYVLYEMYARFVSTLQLHGEDKRDYVTHVKSLIKAMLQPLPEARITIEVACARLRAILELFVTSASV